MPDKNAIRVAPRFTRSVHIGRDFRDLRFRLDGYQVTPLVRQTVGRIMAGLAANATERAFSVIGPFGAGKSAFGLFLAHFLQRRPAARRELLTSLDVPIPDPLLPLDAPTLLSVRVPGNYAPLRQALLQALNEALAGKTRSPAIADLCQILETASHDPALDPVRTAAYVNEAARLLHAEGSFDGLLVVIDELGQFLDYAGRHEEQRDLFVLQSLGEMSARSGNAPVLVVTILHQAFERYTTNAGPTRRVEWAKVQGRFKDLPFQEPAAQMVRMVASALRPVGRDPYKHARQEWITRLARLAEDLGLRPVEIDSAEWQNLIGDTYPIHPTVLVALPSLFRQLAQNERSLFAFLHTDEPWGLRDIVRGPSPDGKLPIYRLTHLYAYLEANLGPALFARARGQRWAELAEARSSLVSDDVLHLDVLTVVGFLGAIERASGLRASQAHIAFALADTRDDRAVIDTLRKLIERRIILYRRYRDSFIIWEGSDIDLEVLIQETRRSIAERTDLTALLQQYAAATPRIARRHSYRTGSTRIFAVRYVEATRLSANLTAEKRYDGELLHVVPADDEELGAAEDWARDPVRASEPWRIVVLPSRLHDLRDLLLEVAALRTLLDEHAELEHDRPARREVAGRLLEAQQILANTIAETYERGCWFYSGQAHRLQNARQIDDLLSRAADATYPHTPLVWNELIVRRQLTSAAAKARRNLVEAMLTRAGEPLLGLTGYPPERAIYESVLRMGGLHRQDGNGVWQIVPPPAQDPLHLRPIWQAMEALIGAEGSKPCPVADLFAHLEGPPYGVKAGLTPLLFVAFYVARAGEISIYERGTYVPTPDIAVFERLMTRPEQFSVHLCRTEGARWHVYERLARALAPQALTQPSQPALLTVILPLLRFINQLPPYSKQTRRLSPRAQAVRQALREARAPEELLFEWLPHACGMPSFGADDDHSALRVEPFVAALREALQELQSAYPHLIETIGIHISAAFGLHATGASGRRELQTRYAAIAATVTDPRLRAIGVRLETADPGDQPWIASLAALVAKRPPETWSDADLLAFETAVVDLGRHFRAAEELALVANTVPPDTRLVRIGVNNGRGEVSRVVDISVSDPAVEGLEADLRAVLERYTDLTIDQRLAALTDLLHQILTVSEPGLCAETNASTRTFVGKNDDQPR